MSNLNLTIAEIMHGDTEVLKIMKGDVEKWPNLPYDAQVEYLQSDGTAYIDTGINTTSSIGIKININIPYVLNGNYAIFGSRIAANNKSYTLLYDKTSSNWSWRFGNTTVVGAEQAGLSGDFVISNKENPCILSINGYTITGDNRVFDNGYNFYLFTMNNAGSAASITNGIPVKWKSVKMYDGSTLVRDFIPVRKDGVGYLYDKVSNTLFGNAAASGAFTYGSDV